jgi:hypothetical protein
MTPTQAKAHRKQLMKEIGNELRAKDRIHLNQIRTRIVEARAARREAIAEAKHQCKAARIALKQKQVAERERIKADQAAERIERRGSCKSSKAQADVEGKGRIVGLRGELHATAKEQRVIERAGKAPRLRSTSGERRAESDDAVRSNIPENLVPVFNKVKAKIKGSARRSRSEAFLEWAHENPEEVLDFQQHDADRYLKELVAQEKEQGRIMRKASRYKPTKEDVAKRLADVPF